MINVVLRYIKVIIPCFTKISLIAANYCIIPTACKMVLPSGLSF